MLKNETNVTFGYTLRIETLFLIRYNKIDIMQNAKNSNVHFRCARTGFDHYVLLSYSGCVGSDRLRDVITQVTVLDRTL